MTRSALDRRLLVTTFGPRDELRGSASLSYVESTLTYASSIDPDLTNLFCRITRDTGWRNSPLLIVQHGFGQDANFPGDATARRLASYGFLVVRVGMRGRNLALGSPDASGRELYDIRDAVRAVRGSTLYSPYLHRSKNGIVGYSGGGANALACRCKFPDLFTVNVSFFGISDYGEDPTDGWYTTNPSNDTVLDAWIGDPGVSLDPYRARNVVSSIATSLRYGGYLYMFHDAGDTTVPPDNSRNVSAALISAGLGAGQFTYNESNHAGPHPWWDHGYPEDVADLIDGEPIFKTRALTALPWKMPGTGDVRVIGYQETANSTIWMGPSMDPKSSPDGGISEVADVEYDFLAGTYEVTPLTGNMWVQISDRLGRTVQQQISAPTLLAVG